MCRIFQNGVTPEGRPSWRWLNPVTAVIASRGGVVSKVTKLGSNEPKEPVVEQLEQGQSYLGTLEMVVTTIENIAKQGLGKYPVSIFVPNAQWNAVRSFHNKARDGAEDPVHEYLNGKESGFSEDEKNIWTRFYAASKHLVNLQIHPHPREDRKEAMIERNQKEISQLENKGELNSRDKRRLEQLRQQMIVADMLNSAWDATPERTGSDLEVDIDIDIEL